MAARAIAWREMQARALRIFVPGGLMLLPWAGAALATSMWPRS